MSRSNASSVAYHPTPGRGDLVGSPLAFSDPPERLRSALRHSLSPTQATTTTTSFGKSSGDPNPPSASNSPVNREAQSDPMDDDEEEEEDEEDNGYLCICYAKGHLGAALYIPESATLLVMEDIVDPNPEFKVATALLRQCNPKHLLVHQKLEKNLRRRVLELCGYPDEELSEDDEESDEVSVSASVDPRTTSADSRQMTGIAPLPSASGATTETRDSALRGTEISFLLGKEFEFASCKRRILNLRFVQEEEGSSEEDHFLFINSLFNLGADVSVRATGALLRFLDQNKITGVSLAIKENFPTLFELFISFFSQD